MSRRDDQAVRVTAFIDDNAALIVRANHVAPTAKFLRDIQSRLTALDYEEGGGIGDFASARATATRFPAAILAVRCDHSWP